MDEDDLVEQLDKLLTSRCVSWLFGAGISRNAGIPLMDGLTDRVFELASDTAEEPILVALKADLPPDCHVEHILSYLADHIAIADRSVGKTSILGGHQIALADLRQAHEKVLTWIALTIRWGVLPGPPPQIGSPTNPLIKIDEHLAFVRTLFNTTLAGVAERRAAVKLFTMNYDTLLEDALALCSISYWDGFDGGAVAYRSYRFGAPEPVSGFRAHLIKLHGSIDWHLDADGRVWRVRDGDLYPTAERRVLIYPQSTKYAATQRDPFSAQFDIFRRQLCAGGGHVLVTCGYSFGDEHINDEISSAMARGDNDAAMIALVSEANGIPVCLAKWRDLPWGKHIYILTERGVYVGDQGPFLAPPAGDRMWWTFASLAQLLASGIKEQLA